MVLKFPKFGFLTKSSGNISKFYSVFRQKNHSVGSQDLVKKFEMNFAENIGDGSGIAFASARMGFFAVLKSLNLSKGDEILLTGFTCSVMANAVIRAGATPVYVDVSEITFGMCPKDLQSKLSKRSKVIVAQHTFGIPCAIDEISNIARSYNITLIEDCALSVGSTLDKINLGDFGDCAIFSFDHSKPINTFSGGLVYTKNRELYDKLKCIQSASPDLPPSYTRSLKLMYCFEQVLLQSGHYPIYLFLWRFMLLMANLKLLKLRYLDQDFSAEPHQAYPYPARLPQLCAYIGLNELSDWGTVKKTRHSYIQNYKSALSKYKINFPPVYEDKRSYIIPLRIIMSVGDETKAKFDKLFDSKWYWFNQPIIEANCQLFELGYERGTCPTSENLAGHIINLPCNQSPEVMAKIFEILESKGR